MLPNVALSPSGTHFQSIAAVTSVMVSLFGCDTQDAKHIPVAVATSRAPSTAAPLELSDHVRSRLKKGTSQGVLRPATENDAKILISIEAEFGAKGDCLATAATYVLSRAGYSASNNWSHEAGVDLHLLASARELDGRPTLVLWNDNAYLAVASQNAAPSRVDVEELLAKLVASAVFQQLGASPEHAGANSVVFPDVDLDQVLIQCPHWRPPTRPSDTGVTQR